MVTVAKRPAAKEEKKPAYNVKEGANRLRVQDVYELGKTLGTGGYAVVKKATHKQTGKTYAVKIMQPETDPDGLTEEDVVKEIDVLKKLEHPSILRLYEHFVSMKTLGRPSKVYVVTELLKGGELLDAMLDKGGYTEAEVRLIMRQLLEAVGYLHKQGVTHRDLKLENLLLAEKDDLATLRVADFGLAKNFAGSTRNEVMETQCGSPLYVAPEVLKGKKYSSEVDLWSCGVILYILLSGTPPFDTEDVAERFQLIMRGEYSVEGEEWGDVSPGAKALVGRLLTVDASKRPSAAEALKDPWMTSTAAGTATLSTGKLRATAMQLQLPVRTLKAGEYLMHQGDASHEMFLLKSGTCDVLLESRVGGATEMTKVAERGAGDFIGEMGFSVDGESKKRTASVRATTKVEVLVLGAADMRWVLQNDSTVERELKEAMEARGRELEKAKGQAVTESAEKQPKGCFVGCMGSPKSKR